MSLTISDIKSETYREVNFEKKLKMDETEKSAKKHNYDDYGASVNDYTEYNFTEEDEVLSDMNMKYSKKGAYVALSLVTVGFCSIAIIMSQQWVPHEPTTTTTSTTTTTTTTTTTSTTSSPPADPDQVP